MIKTVNYIIEKIWHILNAGNPFSLFLIINDLVGFRIYRLNIDKRNTFDYNQIEIENSQRWYDDIHQ